MKEAKLVDLKNASIDEVITGQHILLRKKTVSDAISVYQDQNWLLPTYSNKLHSVNQSGYRKGLERKIDNFVLDCNKEKEEIITQSRTLLRKTNWVIRGKKILYPLHIIKKLLLRK